MPLVEDPPRFSEDRATALLRISEHYLASSDGGAGTLDGPGRCELVLHVNANEAHRDHQVEDGPRCYLDRNRFLSPQTARRLACDAMVPTVVEDDDGAILNFGRRSRTISKALRTALNVRDGGCRFPNCHQQAWTDAHHVHHWADGGETSLDNLITLCRHHHRLLHKGDFTLKQEGNAVTFYNQQMNPITRALYPQCDTANPERVIGRVTLDGVNIDRVAIDSKIAVARWCGEKVDYGLVMDGLLSRDAACTR